MATRELDKVTSFITFMGSFKMQQLTSIFIVILLLSGSTQAASGKTSLAILPFENKAREELQWISSAISDTLIAKLSHEHDLHIVEREKTILLTGGQPYSSSASKDGNVSPPSPSLIGADFLLTGSYTVHQSSIRIFARIIEAQLGSIKGESAITLSGDIHELFDLQEKLAHAFVTACGIEASTASIGYTDGHNSSSYQAYNQAKQCYHEKEYRNAIQLFLKAQQSNDGFFFSEAHHWEGRARTALMKEQTTTQKKKIIEKEYLAKFEADAAEAAVGFFDLGVAQQACEKWEEALHSYDEYLRWHNSSARPFRWEIGGYQANKKVKRGKQKKSYHSHCIVRTEEAPHYYEHGVREREQSNYGPHRSIDNYRHWIMDDGMLYTVIKDSLECRSIPTGELIWKRKVNMLNRQLRLSSRYLAVNYLVKRGGVLYLSSLNHTLRIDASNGIILRTYSLGLKEWRYEGTFHVVEKQDLLLFHVNTHKDDLLTAVSISSGEVYWEKKLEFSNPKALHADTLYTTAHKSGKDGVIKIDLKSGSSMNISDLPDRSYQLWPGEDHLLVRCVTAPTDGVTDSFFRVSYQDNSISRAKNLFFSPFYPEVPDHFESKMIPLMDSKKETYDLVPAVHFFPRLTVKGLDDEITYDVITRYDFPWVRKTGNRLQVWHSDRTCRVFDVNTGELLWRKHLPKSLSGIDGNEKYIVTNAQPDLIQIYYVDSLNHDKSVSAITHKTEVLQHLNRWNSAVTNINLALKNSPDDLFAVITAARLHHNMGNINEAIEHYLLVLKVAPTGTSAELKEAKRYLRSSIGLTDLLPPEKYHHHKKHLYISYQKGEQRELRSYDLDKNNWTDMRISGVPLGKVKGSTMFSLNSKGSLLAVDLVKKESRTMTIDSTYKPEQLFSHVFRLIENLILYPSQVSQKEKTLCARDLSSGDLIWKLSLGEVDEISLSSTEHHVIVTLYQKKDQHSARVLSIDPSSGTVIWKRSIPFHRRVAKVSGAVHKGGRAFEDQGELIFWFDFTGGNFSVNFSPEKSVYRLDPQTGNEIGVIASPELFHEYHNTNRTVSIQTWTWAYAPCSIATVIVKDGWMQKNESLEDMRIVPADFTEPHPALLARLNELTHLSEEFDLTHHAEALNVILRSPSKRKEFINRYRKGFIKRNHGSEFFQNHTKSLLQKKALTEEEEILITRQLMSFWRTREPFCSIRAYRYPAAVRTWNAQQIEHPQFGRRYAIGYHRGSLMAADLEDHQRLVTTWNRLPKTYPYRPYHHGVSPPTQQGKHLVLRTDDGIMVYDTVDLLNFITKTVVVKNGAFSLGGTVKNLEHLVDGDPTTAAEFIGDDFVALGIDFGIKVRHNTISLNLGLHSTSIDGAMVQASNHSETSGFKNIAMITSATASDRSIKTTFPQKQKYRYYRLLIPKSCTLSLRELSFSSSMLAQD